MNWLLCDECLKTLPKDKFRSYIDNRDKKRRFKASCRKCENEINKRFQKANRDKANKWKKDYYIRNPWAKFHNAIMARCGNKNHHYYKKGIKNYLKVADLKQLWMRNDACLMKQPSIHRLESNKHYTLDNCKFIERKDNHR